MTDYLQYRCQVKSETLAVGDQAFILFERAVAVSLVTGFKNLYHDLYVQRKLSLNTAPPSTIYVSSQSMSTGFRFVLLPATAAPDAVIGINHNIWCSLAFLMAKYST